MKTRSGYFLINKPTGITSNDLVQKVKKKFNLDKVGHSGTLDPLASGLMVVLVNQATKVSEFFLSAKKEYEFTIKLFETTETLDSEGPIIEKQKPFKIFKSDLNKVIKKYNGYMYQQFPPLYSAIKVDGKRLYEYARDGGREAPNINSREVSIYSLMLKSFNTETNEITLVASCSKGTYIRSLALDIAKELKTIGYVTYLHRTKSGAFGIEEATDLDKLKLENIFTIYQGLILSEYPIYEHKNLKEIYHGKSIKINAKEETIFLSNTNNEIQAIYVRVAKGIYKCKRGLWETDKDNMTIAQKVELHGE
ncbi:tRNA pseudouridine synthase B [Spiroplasma sp. TIUS-1]|uniref:tRNA pseudouridine(55) synthase TruB n=1 Tax=Spiroplasma sp. TIUS-1 TaxID=216963 RepID=UPI00139745F9|nr:tRNA pseudouridine(55) synthase TruB [Spiroplasma sp. TIUS-1]QHX35891.1 tRNA pseudouridine synthase B [Spiroplasma sp. TIUS-1]